MGGGKKENAPEIDNLSQYARALFNESAGLRKEFASQGLEALKTGGIGAQIPMIARAVEASKGQLAQDLNQTDMDMAKYRLNGTPFGEMVKSQARIAGNQSIANIPTSMASNFVSMLPNFMASMTGAGMSGLSNAANAQTNLYSSYNNAYSQILSAGIPKAMDMGGKLIGSLATMPFGGAGGVGGAGAIPV